MTRQGEHSYNERLFSNGLRGRLHRARFHWLNRETKRLGVALDAVLELGCYDGKTIDYLPRYPKRYLGLDANWEGGLLLAAQRWSGYPQFSFVECDKPDEISLGADEVFDIAIMMETLEHVSPEMVTPYLRKIEQHVSSYVFITVPNEKGLVLFGKWLAKRLLTLDADEYSWSEILNATLGRMHKVERREHKGFDWQVLAEEVEKFFEIVRVSGLPAVGLPPSLSFGVGIVGRKRS